MRCATATRVFRTVGRSTSCSAGIRLSGRKIWTSCKHHQRLERPLEYQVLLHSLSGDQVLLDDAFEHLRIAFPVPCAFGIDHGNRTTLADTQTIGFGPQDAARLG